MGRQCGGGRRVDGAVGKANHQFRRLHASRGMVPYYELLNEHTLWKDKNWGEGWGQVVCQSVGSDFSFEGTLPSIHGHRDNTVWSEAKSRFGMTPRRSCTLG